MIFGWMRTEKYLVTVKYWLPKCRVHKWCKICHFRSGQWHRQISHWLNISSL